MFRAQSALNGDLAQSQVYQTMPNGADNYGVQMKPRVKSAARLAPLAASHSSLGKPPMHRMTQQIQLNGRIRSARPGMVNQNNKLPTHLNRAQSALAKKPRYEAEEPFCKDTSPFRAAEVEIFVQREKAKQMKERAKSALLSQKIWEKNTATTRSRLLRIKEDDISPRKVSTTADASDKFTFDAKSRCQINAALQVARSRVTLPKVAPGQEENTNPNNNSGRMAMKQKKRPNSSLDSLQQKIDEFINQKKEMFRVQLAYNTLDKEIVQLKEQEVRRQQALVQSQQELDEDKKKVMNFVQKDNLSKKAKENKVQELFKKKVDKEETTRRQETLLQQHSSEIEKNLETVGQLGKFRDFLLNLAKPDDVAAQDLAKENQLYQIKSDWIARVRNDTYLDDLIFGYTDIFPIDQNSGAAGQISPDHMDILEACGITLPPV